MSALRFGPFGLSLYGAAILTGVIGGIILSYLEARRRGENTQHILNLPLVILPAGIIGARLYHVIDQWDFYRQHPLQIIGGAGLGIFGALAGGAIGLVIYTWLKRLSTLRWLDIAAPGVILAQAIGRWGNYFNQELYGYPTDLPWGIFIDPAHRLPGYEAFTHFHPLFLYESLWNMSGCALLLIVGRKWQKRLLDGDIFFLYIVYYGTGRFFLEGLKINVWTITGIPTARWIAVAAIVFSAAAAIYRHSRRKVSAP